MITCPRCGYQAPDGTPWCPRCGYGCPYPVPYQQPPQQMSAQYQPQPIPAQYDVVDVPPQPDPEPKPKQKRRKKKRKLPKWLKIILIIIGFISLPFVILVIWAIADTIKNPPAIPTRTPTATFTATVTMTPTETMTLTFTPIPPTATPIPSDTPVPTDTPIPLPEGAQYYTVREGENCWTIARDHGISEYDLLQANGMANCNIGIGDQIIIPAAAAVSYVPAQTYTDNSYAQPNTGIRGSVQDTTGSNCNIKGNINNEGEKIYHCPGWRDYNKTDIDEWKGERWFCSAAEAEAAGWRAAGYKHGSCVN